MAVQDIGNQFSGPRAAFSVDGKVFAWGNAVSWGENYQKEAYRPLGCLETREHVVLGYAPSVSCSGVLLVNENLTTQGMQAPLGTNQNEHLLNLLAQNNLTISIEDSTSGKRIATAFGCSIASVNTQVSSGTMAGLDISFDAIRIEKAGDV